MMVVASRGPEEYALSGACKTGRFARSLQGRVYGVPGNAYSSGPYESGLSCRASSMNPSAIEVGAFSWARIQRLYDADAAIHWQRCESEGLQCPQEVFAQLFHEEANNEDFAVIVRSLDWGRVRWELQEMSGVALRHVRVDRAFQLALDEARDHAVCYGIVDEREEVVSHWKDSKSWLVPPVVVGGELLGGGSGFELLVGHTRLGNLLEMLDREEVKETQKHLVWVGRSSKTD
jgi:hypothetical protein